MYMKSSEFKAIERILNNLDYHYTPDGLDFNNLPEDARKALEEADQAMAQIFKRSKESNQRTAKYIAERRKTDKNYARKRKENA